MHDCQSAATGEQEGGMAGSVASLAEAEVDS